MALIDMEPEQFIIKAFTEHAPIETEPMVLDDGTAGMVYLFHGKKDICYMNRLFTGTAVRKDPEVILQLYPKMALSHPSH